MDELLPHELESSLSEFRRTLTPADRTALDDLLQKAQKLRPAVRSSGHPLPYLTALVALLIEEHKELARLRQVIEDYLMETDYRGKN
jgi:hypothetical protein